MDALAIKFLLLLHITCLFGFAQPPTKLQDSITLGLIVDKESWFGKLVQVAIEVAVEDINNARSLGNTQLLLLVNDSKGDSVEAATAARWLLKQKVVTLIGPESSSETDFVTQLCSASAVPLISYSATDPSLSTQRYPFFLRLPPSDATQSEALAALVSHYSWRNVVVIYVDNDFGMGILSSLTESLHKVECEIMQTFAILSNADIPSISEVLLILKSMQTRVFIVHTTTSIGVKIFREAKSLGMMEKAYAWILTEGVASDLKIVDPKDIENMQGVLATRTFIDVKKPKARDFERRWRRRFISKHPEYVSKSSVNTFGYLAYDAVLMFARALNQISNNTFAFTQEDQNGVKMLLQGPVIRDLMFGMKFEGVSGLVKMQNGQAVGFPYEIINIVGKMYQSVGYWTKDVGLCKELGCSLERADKLGAVIWPGQSLSIPKGWVNPIDQNRLRIGVPLRVGFKEFIESGKPKIGHEYEIHGGFVIDVFKLALERLPYALPHQFIPIGDDNVPTDYENIIIDLFNKKYDAAVGDITILANRSRFVDFTQSYLESGLAMVTKIKKVNQNNAWVFYQPFSWGTWLCSGILFFWIAFVVWLLERKYNNDFRGDENQDMFKSACKQAVQSLWFSFSTLFFAHREEIKSSPSRLVMIIWLFFVLILTSSYTASLTSMLTAQEMEPEFKNLHVLKASGKHVGFPNGSFVRNFLINELEFEEKRLKGYISEEQYHQAFSNGEIAAIFLELPYVRVFLAKYCDYTIVEPTFRTGGLGFVFPKGSPLVSDMSRAILEVSESREMQMLQNKWFNRTFVDCSDEDDESGKLGFDSFWSLYAIAITPCLIGLVVHNIRWI